MKLLRCCNNVGQCGTVYITDESFNLHLKLPEISSGLSDILE